jgi:hypothetical protein
MLEKLAAAVDAQSAGLPAGAQIVGRPWAEALVLAAMEAVEEEVRGDEGFPQTPVGAPSDRLWRDLNRCAFTGSTLQSSSGRGPCLSGNHLVAAVQACPPSTPPKCRSRSPSTGSCASASADAD